MAGVGDDRGVLARGRSAGGDRLGEPAHQLVERDVAVAVALVADRRATAGPPGCRGGPPGRGRAAPAGAPVGQRTTVGRRPRPDGHDSRSLRPGPDRGRTPAGAGTPPRCAAAGAGSRPCAWPAAPPRCRRRRPPRTARASGPRRGRPARRPGSCRAPTARRRRPPASPSASTTVPGHASGRKAPNATDSPRPPAPRSHGDQLWPATPAVAATAPRTGRSRPASSGPTTPLATSHAPATASGPNPATSYSAVPDTVPLPTSRRSTSARRRAARFENGTEPASQAAATTTGAGRRCGRRRDAVRETFVVHVDHMP